MRRVRLLGISWTVALVRKTAVAWLQTAGPDVFQDHLDYLGIGTSEGTPSAATWTGCHRLHLSRRGRGVTSRDSCGDHMAVRAVFRVQQGQAGANIPARDCTTDTPSASGP